MPPRKNKNTRQSVVENDYGEPGSSGEAGGEVIQTTATQALNPPDSRPFISELSGPSLNNLMSLTPRHALN